MQANIGLEWDFLQARFLDNFKTITEEHAL